MDGILGSAERQINPTKVVCARPGGRAAGSGSGGPGISAAAGPAAGVVGPEAVTLLRAVRPRRSQRAATHFFARHRSRAARTQSPQRRPGWGTRDLSGGSSDSFLLPEYSSLVTAQRRTSAGDPTGAAKLSSIRWSSTTTRCPGSCAARDRVVAAQCAPFFQRARGRAPGKARSASSCRRFAFRRRNTNIAIAATIASTRIAIPSGPRTKWILSPIR